LLFTRQNIYTCRRKYPSFDSYRKVVSTRKLVELLTSKGKEYSNKCTKG